MAAAIVWRGLRGAGARSDAAWIGAAVFSHWGLDLIVHRPDLPLYDDTLKSGLGLWNYPVIALALEALFLLGGMGLYLKRTGTSRAVGRLGPPIFGILMLGIQVYVFFGPRQPLPRRRRSRRSSRTSSWPPLRSGSTASRAGPLRPDMAL